MPMIKLVIADDHAVMREGLKKLIATLPGLQVVGEAANGTEVLECLRQESIDLLLLDLNMPGLSGADLIKRVKRARADLPILVFTMHNDPQIALRMIKAGVSGYITKDCEPGVLLAAICEVADHGKYIAREIAEQIVFDSVAASELPHHQLSDRELQVFNLLASGKSVNDIATQLTISNKTVSTHKAHLMEKMQLATMAALMRYAIQHELID